MAKAIEMLFGTWTQVGPRNYVLDGGPDAPTGRAHWGTWNSLVYLKLVARG